MKTLLGIRFVRFSLVAACIGFLALITAQATTILRVDSLPALVAESSRAVLATVSSVHTGYDEHHLPATFLEVRVEDGLYGETLPPVGQTLRIKLYGSAEPMTDGLRVHLDGTPRYRAGQRYLLLLIDDSPWGFTNAAGLFLGVFRIEKGEHGALTAESLGGNDLVLGQTGPVLYSELRSLVLSLKRGEVAP